MLGNENGEGRLFLTSHSIHASTVPRERRYHELRVPLRTLDNLIANGEAVSPDVIKIDVEGGEFKVFQGAELTICLVCCRKLHLMIFSGLMRRAQPPYPFGNFLALSPRHASRV